MNAVLNFLNRKISLWFLVSLAIVVLLHIVTSPLLLPIDGYRKVITGVPVVSFMVKSGQNKGMSTWGIERVELFDGRTWWIRYHTHRHGGGGYSDLSF